MTNILRNLFRSRIFFAALLSVGLLPSFAQNESGLWFSSTNDALWNLKRVPVSGNVIGTPEVVYNLDNVLGTFEGWGTCFNELGWDALSLLSQEEQEMLMQRMFAPDGDLRFTVGRIPVGASDYARNWYSCNETDGDFKMEHFSISRDKEALIPYIKFAQKYNPDMTFWGSPWSPPTWMKTNRHYANKSGANNGLPTNMQVPVYFNDQFIMEPDYLNAYALYFGKFVDAYKAEGIPVTAICYQNEAYSYTVYPGCSWTAKGTAIFNADYLGPYFAEHYPDVEIWMGTMNTASLDVFEEILNYPGITKYCKGVGYQWEARNALPEIRYRYPELDAMQTESECGSGTFDWAAAAHTFELIHHYLSNGCMRYNYWNAVLKDNGASSWGWIQNSLVQVNSSTREAFYTPEYYALKHYSHFIAPGSGILKKCTDCPLVLAAQRPDGLVVVVAGNESSSERTLTLSLDGKYLNVKLSPKSFNTFVLGDEEELSEMVESEGGLTLDAPQDEYTDVTVYLSNPCFTNGTTGWTLDNVVNGGDIRSANIAGRTCLNSWSNDFTSMNVFQDVSGLLPGKYIVSSRAMCGPGEITDQHLYAVAGDVTVVSPSKQVAIWNTEAGWELQTTEPIEVGEDGTLRIGYASTSGGGTKGWFCVTDFRLKFLGENEDIKNAGLQKAAEEYEGVVAEAEALLADPSAIYTVEAKDALRGVMEEHRVLIPRITSPASYADLCRQLYAEMDRLRISQQPGEDTDFTFLVKSADMETFGSDGNPAGWTFSNTNGDAIYKNGEHYSGNSANHYVDSYNQTPGWMYYTGHQLVSGLPSGTYRLVCAARASGEGFFITAQTSEELLMREVTTYNNVGGPIWEAAEDGSAEKAVNGGKGRGWQYITVDDIHVRDGKLAIGFTNDKYLTGKEWGGTWFSADDFKLYYISSDFVSTAIGHTVVSHESGLHVIAGKNSMTVFSVLPYVVCNAAGAVVDTDGYIEPGIYIVKSENAVRKVLVY